MKRFLQQLLVITLLAAGFSTTAQAQYPNHIHRHYATAPTVVVYGGNTGYGAGYGNGYGYTNNFTNYNGYSAGYYGYAPAVPLYPQTAPYGAGYSGGWRPYQDMYLQRLYYGLGN
jgi:hypothetical protein